MTRTRHTPPLRFETLDDVTAALRDGGGRVSMPRRMVLQFLFETDVPVSAEDIATRLGLEVTSVYRNLERLEELGVVRHVHLGHGPGLYGLVGRATGEYLVCEVCDRVTALDPERAAAVRATIREQSGFHAHFGHFPIHGVCADCSDERAGAAPEPAGR